VDPSQTASRTIKPAHLKAVAAVLLLAAVGSAVFRGTTSPGDEVAEHASPSSKPAKSRNREEIPQARKEALSTRGSQQGQPVVGGQDPSTNEASIASHSSAPESVGPTKAGTRQPASVRHGSHPRTAAGQSVLPDQVERPASLLPAAAMEQPDSWHATVLAVATASAPPQFPLVYEPAAEKLLADFPDAPAEILDTLKDSFEKEAGVGTLDPASPAYEQEWRKAEISASMRLRTLFGWGADAHLQREALLRQMEADSP